MESSVTGSACSVRTTVATLPGVSSASFGLGLLFLPLGRRVAFPSCLQVAFAGSCSVSKEKHADYIFAVMEVIEMSSKGTRKDSVSPRKKRLTSTSSSSLLEMSSTWGAGGVSGAGALALEFVNYWELFHRAMNDVSMAIVLYSHLCHVGGNLFVPHCLR
eukprot:g22206.t1